MIKKCNRYSSISNKQRIDVVMTDDNLKFDILCSTKSFSQENYDYFSNNGVDVISIPDAGECGISNYTYALDNFFRDNNKYDLVYAHNGYLSFFVYLSARKFGIRNFALHSHATKMSPNKIKNLAAHILKPFINRFYKHKFSCSTEAGKEMFNTKNFALIPNAIDYNKYKFDSEKKLVNVYPSVAQAEKENGFSRNYLFSTSSMWTKSPLINGYYYSRQNYIM